MVTPRALFFLHLKMQKDFELKKRSCSDYFLRFSVADVEKSL